MSDKKHDDETRGMAESAGLRPEPDPIPTDAPSAHDLVIDEIRKRKEFGLAKYGTLLQHDNGRDHLQDALDEVLDQAVYLMCEVQKRKDAAARAIKILTPEERLAALELGRVILTDDHHAPPSADQVVEAGWKFAGFMAEGIR